MANLVEIKHIQDILHYLATLTNPRETLVLFDIDDVLINTIGDFGGFRWWEHRIEELVKNGSTYESAIDRMNKFYLKLQPYLRYTPIEKTTVATFTAIQQLGVTVMGLTGRAQGTAPLTYKELSDLGIQFSSEKSIIFCDGLCKGEKLDLFLTSMQEQPRQIIFVDDLVKNLLAVNAMLQKQRPSIKFIGLFYSHIKTFTSYDPAQAEAEWRAIEDKHGEKLSL